MRILPLAVGALLLAVPAKADKFWLTDPAAPKSAENSSPDYLQGVLLGEDADVYHVRIVGGEIQLAKKSVFRVEKDALSIEQILDSEKQDAARMATAKAERKAVPAASKRKGASAAEASAKRTDPAAAAAAPAPVFDPTIGRALPAMSDAEIQRDLELAWSMTKDRRYLIALRQLRRAH